MNKTKVLIAGWLWFIWLNMSQFLLSKWYKVIIIDNLSSSSIDNIKILNKTKNLIFLNEDICNIDVYNTLFKNIKIIYNFATIASPKKYQKNWIETIKANTIWLLNLLEIARLNYSLFFQSSTSEIYWDPLNSIQNEKYLWNVNSFWPRSCYDEWKRVAESICYEYIKKFNLDIKIWRLFNIYWMYMQKDDGRVIPNFINRALKWEDILIYWDWLQNRSFLFIEDLISWIEYLMSSNLNTPVNIWSNFNYKIIDVAKYIIKLTMSKSSIIFVDSLQDDPLNRNPDLSFILSNTNWRPIVKFEEWLNKTINYFKFLN